MPQLDSSSYVSFVDQIQKLTYSNQGQNYQQQLAEYPADYMLDLIYDQLQSLDTRKMACTILRLKLSSKQKCISQNINPNEVLARLQTLYMINATNNKQLYRLQNTIQIVVEKIFETYFDDMQRITMFEQISQQLPKEPLCKQVKHLAFLEMLVRQMNYLSLNSEVMIGQMVLYLGEMLLFMEMKGICVNEDGSKAKQTQQEDVCEILLKSVALMKQIKEIVDENNQDEDNYVTEFMINSKQLRNHLISLLRMHFKNSNQNSQLNQQSSVITIWTLHPKLNKVKAEVLSLWHDVWQYYAQPDLLQLLLATVLSISKPQIADEIQPIITSCLMLLQRSCYHRQYADIFFKMTQNLTLKLFELICINESEYSLISTDIGYFIEINEDFCKQQEMQTMKTRAGSLLANLTLAIDGYLTFVTQIAIISARQHLFNEEKSQSQQKIWNGVMQSWSCSKEQLMETSLLILSSISDQVSKRSDLLGSIDQHLRQMIPYLSPQMPLHSNPLFILRYMQLYSFYSFPHCLDHFLRHYSSQQIYQQQLSKSFQTLMRYYDRKNPEMQQYVKDIANSIMLLGDQLTPLLEQEIMRNNKVIQNFKENVLEKLVVWFLHSYQKQQVLKINKLSTLIVRLLHDNMQSQLQSDPNIKPFSPQTLSTYLQLVYKSLQTSHPCEQTIIQIGISHIEYLFDLQQIDLVSCQNFYQMGKIVTQRNQLSLNDCLMLFNSLVCPDVPVNRKGKWNNWRYDELTLNISLRILSQLGIWLQAMWEQTQKQSQQIKEQQQVELREEDVWEMLHLTEICLFQVQACKGLLAKKSQPQIKQLKNSSAAILDFCFKLSDNCRSNTLKSKEMSVVLQVVQMFPQNMENYGFLSHLKYPNPCDFPAYECRKYLYCLVNIMRNYMVHFDPQLRIRMLRVIIDLIYFLQNQKTHIKTYDQLQYINGDGVSMNALQKRNKTYSAFDFRIDFQPHERFRQLIHNYPQKEKLCFLNQDKAFQGKIRDLIDKIIVGDKTRKKFTVKRNL